VEMMAAEYFSNSQHAYSQVYTKISPEKVYCINKKSLEKVYLCRRNSFEKMSC